jgi:hypothetical protein
LQSGQNNGEDIIINVGLPAIWFEGVRLLDFKSVEPTMQRAYIVLGSAITAAVGATAWAHIAQIRQRDRMHAGVVRDMAKERVENEKKAADLALMTADGTEQCVGDVCAHTATRFRDPGTGKVYERIV